jgi:two-component system response regulator QseB
MPGERQRATLFPDETTANVRLYDDTRVLLTDFGIACGMDDVTSVTDTFAGSPAYAAARLSRELRSYDVVVLDRGLPAIEGLDLLSRLRLRGVITPTLVLSALANPADRVAGLDAGAEDYLGKPFDLDELLARLRALRRRHLDAARSLPLPGGRLEPDTRSVTLTDRDPVRLSERECDLLAALATRPGTVFSRRQLLTLVFDDAESDAVVDTYVHYLRRKLGRGDRHGARARIPTRAWPVTRDPDTRLVHRTMLRLGLQSAAAVLVAVTLLGVAVVLIIQHTQEEQQNDQLTPVRRCPASPSTSPYYG